MRQSTYLHLTIHCSLCTKCVETQTMLNLQHHCTRSEKCTLSANCPNGWAIHTLQSSLILHPYLRAFWKYWGCNIRVFYRTFLSGHFVLLFEERRICTEGELPVVVRSRAKNEVFWGVCYPYHVCNFYSCIVRFPTQSKFSAPLNTDVLQVKQYFTTDLHLSTSRI